MEVSFPCTYCVHKQLRDLPYPPIVSLPCHPEAITLISKKAQHHTRSLGNKHEREVTKKKNESL